MTTENIVVASSLSETPNKVDQNRVKRFMTDLVIEPRFGQGVMPKDGTLYYGLTFASAENQTEPEPGIVFSDKRNFIGMKELTEIGFRKDKPFVADTMLLGAWKPSNALKFLQGEYDAGLTAKQLLEGLVAINKRYMSHTDERTHLALMTYAVAASMYTVFPSFARWVFVGAAGSGKTVQADIIAKLTANGKHYTPQTTEASLIRSVEVNAGLVVLDNMDDPELLKTGSVSLLWDVGHSPASSAKVEKDKKGEFKTTYFNVYCPMIMTTTSDELLPASSMSRAFRLMFITHDKNCGDCKRLEKANTPEVTAALEEMNHLIRIWCLTHYREVRQVYNELNVASNGREAENANPLLAVAKLAGAEVFEELSEYLEDIENAKTQSRNAESEETELLEVMRELLESDKSELLFLEARGLAELMAMKMGIQHRGDGNPDPAFDKQVRYLAKTARKMLITHIGITNSKRSSSGRLQLVVLRQNAIRYLKGRGVKVSGEETAGTKQEAL